MAKPGPKPIQNARRSVIAARLEPGEARTVAEAARRAGCTISDWLREVAVREATAATCAA